MIYPDCDMKRWESCNNSVVLANADYYYTKEQVDKKIAEADGMDEDAVQDLIDKSIKGKADKSEVNALAEQVRENSNAILNTYNKQETNALLASYYTKIETNALFAGYSKVENETLSLNDNNISI